MSFAADLQGFARRTGIRFDQVVRKITIDVMKDLVLATPVDTGNARANYFVGYTRSTDLDTSFATLAHASRQFSGDLSTIGPMTRSDRDALAAMRFYTGAKTSKGAISQARSATNKNQAGTVSLQRAAAFAAGVRGGDVFFITNNVPYIMSLEYGHSQQAPAGMARITVSAWQARVDRIVRSL